MSGNRKYHGRQLKDVYSYLLEGDSQSSTLSTILQMPVERLKNYLKGLKNSHPYEYGKLIFRACITDRSAKSKIVQALSEK